MIVRVAQWCIMHHDGKVVVHVSKLGNLSIIIIAKHNVWLNIASLSIMYNLTKV